MARVGPSFSFRKNTFLFCICNLIYTVCLETELSVQKWDSNLPPQVADLPHGLGDAGEQAAGQRAQWEATEPCHLLAAGLVAARLVKL